MFLAGLTAALLGALGLPAGAGGRWLRRCAAAITAAGLLAAGDRRRAGRHRPARRPRHDRHPGCCTTRPTTGRCRYTPVCSHTPIPVCLHPAYTVYLPAVTQALEPVLDRDWRACPARPRASARPPPDYQQGPDNASTSVGLARLRAARHRCSTCSCPSRRPRRTCCRGCGRTPPRASWTASSAAAATRAQHSRRSSEAIAGHLHPSARYAPTAAAAQRFAALPAAARHAWLVEHLAALRAGQLTLEQLP